MKAFYKIAASLLLLVTVVACNNKATSFSLPSTQDSFGQTVVYNNKVDILFLIDNSKSMLQHQQRLAARVPDMINALNQLHMDYHVAVTTTTMTTNSSTYPMTRQIVGNPKYLTSANINQLGSRLVAGESGSDNERGLDALAYVTGAYASSQAPGFLRSDAFFSVIILGDEDDQSSEFGDGSKNDFVDYMNTFRPDFKEGGRAWIANYIGTISNQSCDNLGASPSVGTKYMKIVDASGGVKASICSSDFTSALTNIKARIVERITTYHLKDIPDKTTIRVSVGGVEIFEDAVNGWTLESETSNGRVVYMIKFHGTAIPAADQQINVDYRAAGAS